MRYLYTVRVDFHAEGEIYGSETYRNVHATSDKDARTQALQRADNSPYADVRIDYVRDVTIIDKEEKD